MSKNVPRNGCADFAAEVRAFYEQHPYPAPVTDLSGYREQWSDRDRQRAAFHLLWPTEPYRDDLEILVAGCGTSQAARHAMRDPGARVTGIDISESSLEHTRALQRKHSLDNLELHHLPLERVHTLGQRFDKIICTGVLHHLPDPDAGLHALREALAPDGAMQLMVYAQYGRTGVYMLQEYCRLLGIRPLDQELDDLSAMLGSLPHEHPLAYLLHRAKDFRTRAALADALLNPQDRAYTVPQIYAWLASCGLAFERWTLQAPYHAQCGMVSSTPQADRLAALCAQQQHAALELFRGTMVKHEFVARHEDQSPRNLPIRFSDEHWLAYVPIRAPATKCIQERLPAGAVAVLLNPAHTHTDIFLPVDAFEKRLFDTIDATRSIDQILAMALPDADDTDGRERARCFFEQLWLYDQIVFNASEP